MSLSYSFRKIDPPPEGCPSTRRSESRFPRVERALRIERGLHAPCDREARTEFIAQEVRELHADAVHVFHRAAERHRAADDLINGGCDRPARGRAVRTHRTHHFKGDKFWLRPHAEADGVDAVTSENRETGPTEGEDLRPRQRGVDIIEDDVLQEPVGARHPGSHLVVDVDDVMPRPPVLPSLSVREAPPRRRAETPTRDPPGGGDQFTGSGEPEVQDRRPGVGSPWNRPGRECLLE